MAPKTEQNGTADNLQDRMVDKVRKHEDQLPEKKFVLRNSILTDLFENEHIKTVYHLFLAIFLGLFVNTFVHDLMVAGDVKIGLRLIWAGFRNVHLSFLIWAGYYVATCLCYVAFIVWARVRVKMPPKSQTIQLWDKAWFAGLIGYYVLSFRIAQQLVMSLDLPPPARAIVVIEQVRLLMKIHAFVRTNAETVLRFKVHSDDAFKLPKFSHFVYFTFAPTLLYRDEYPRTNSTNWNKVVHYLLEFIGMIFYFSFVFERLVIPTFQDFGNTKFTKTKIVLAAVENSLPGILILLTCFYMCLHTVQNLFAELLRFGDRMFYKDWWRCTSFSEYYRTWNVVVHDWLYTYVYKDMVQIVAPNNRVFAKSVVFLLSAAVHEWILTCMFGLFLPVQFVQFFVIGTVLNFTKGPKHALLNIFFWWSLAFGTGLMTTFYTMEYFARKNVPIENETFIHFFLPRFLTCDCII